MNNCDTIYTVALVFILIALIKPLDVFVARGLNMLDPETGMPKIMAKVIYGLILIGIFAAIYFLSDIRNCKEDFFFQVSPCNAKCSGAFYGKPATFQFSPLSNEGTKCNGQECGYGMYQSSCNNPACRAIVFGSGMYPSINPKMIREGV